MPQTDTLIGKKPPVMGEHQMVAIQINETDLLAGTPQYLPAPFDGHVEEIMTAVQGAVTTGGAIAVSTGAAVGSLAAVVGASVTIADAAPAGTVQSAKATDPSSTKYFSKGDLIAVTPAAAFATAGAVNVLLKLRSGADLG